MNRTSIEWVKNPDGSQGKNWNIPYDLYKPDRTKRVYGIYCNIDLFEDRMPFFVTNNALTTIRRNSQHRFYLLTKQPQNLQKFSPFPDNCWVGVSATDQNQFDTAMEHLTNIVAKVKYISFEPLLDHIEVDGWLGLETWWCEKCDREVAPAGVRFDETHDGCGGNCGVPPPIIDWLIIGSQTKPYKPPKIEWVKEIVEAADRAGVPVFLKNNLKPLLMDINQEYVRYDHMTWDGKTLRQEMPVV